MDVPALAFSSALPLPQGAVHLPVEVSLPHGLLAPLRDTVPQPPAAHALRGAALMLSVVLALYSCQALYFNFYCVDLAQLLRMDCGPEGVAAWVGRTKKLSPRTPGTLSTSFFYFSATFGWLDGHSYLAFGGARMGKSRSEKGWPGRIWGQKNRFCIFSCILAVSILAPGSTPGWA